MKECVILSGGLGTRLQSVVSDIPKSMADIAGRPFLEYLFDYLEGQGFNHVILSLGYKAEIIIDWLEKQDRPFTISYLIEEQPLGTGGAIKYAFEKVITNQAYVFNGDTFFDVDSNHLSVCHKNNEADISIALKYMEDFDRYGSVEINDSGKVTGFNEKRYCSTGLINGGVYLIKKEIFTHLDLPQKFSFEKDILEKHISDLKILGQVQNKYFIDIGIPEDFERANIDFRAKFENKIGNNGLL